jgi:hypothetical protein
VQQILMSVLRTFRQQGNHPTPTGLECLPKDAISSWIATTVNLVLVRGAKPASLTLCSTASPRLLKFTQIH